MVGGNLQRCPVDATHVNHEMVGGTAVILKMYSSVREV